MLYVDKTSVLFNLLQPGCSSVALCDVIENQSLHLCIKINLHAQVYLDK